MMTIVLCHSEWGAAECPPGACFWHPNIAHETQTARHRRLPLCHVGDGMIQDLTLQL